MDDEENIRDTIRGHAGLLPLYISVSECFALEGAGTGAVPADVGLLMGPVQFQIGHACVFGGLPRPWLRREARHWDSRGTLHTRTFWHQQGYEWADFGWQPVGSSRGDA